MVRTEQEYLNTLKELLAGYISSEDLEEILEEYAGHFSIGKSKGRTEEELCTALGPPEDVAKEIRAAYLIKKAEQTKSAGTLWQATRAATGLHKCNFFVVMIPFVLAMAVFCLVFIAGLAMVFGGAVLLFLDFLKLLGITFTIPWLSSPIPGFVASLAIFVAGAVVIVLDIWLMHFVARHIFRNIRQKFRVKKNAGIFGPENPVPKTFAIDRDGATALELHVGFRAGELSVGSGTDGPALMNMNTGSGNSVVPLAYSASMAGTVKKVWIKNRHVSWWSEHDWSGHDCSAYSWDIRLTRDVPVALDFKNQAGRTRLALGELNISSLTIRNGVGETMIDLAGYHGGNFDASIRNGVGNLVIRLPKDCTLSVEIQRGLGDTNVRGLIVDGDTYTLNSANPHAPQIRCHIKQGVGSISVEAV